MKSSDSNLVVSAIKSVLFLFFFNIEVLNLISFLLLVDYEHNDANNN